MQNTCNKVTCAAALIDRISRPIEPLDAKVLANFGSAEKAGSVRLQRMYFLLANILIKGTLAGMQHTYTHYYFMYITE